MNNTCVLGAILLLALGWSPAGAFAQDRQEEACLRGRSGQPRPAVLGESQPRRADSAGTSDVVLDVPRLSVEKLRVEVDTLHARLSLDGSVANLVRINAGVSVQAKDVRVLLCGLDTEAFLRVHLDNITRILTRALQTLDKNPGLLRELDSPSGGPPPDP